MLNSFAIDSISEQSLGMWYPAIFMTSHYDLKQQEKNNGVLGAGLGEGGHKYFCHISGGGVFFPKGWGVVKIFAYHMKM